MKLKLKVIEDPATGSGAIHMIVDKNPVTPEVVGFVNFSDKDSKDFYMRLLSQDGKLGELIH